MLPTPYLLLVEDNPGDARLTQMLLAEPGLPALPDLRWVQSIEAAIKTLESAAGCTAVLLDLGLPDSQGLDALLAVKPHVAQCPVVVLTGDDTEAVGLAAVAAGAQDFLVKGSFDAGLLRRCIGFAGQRKRMELALLQRSLQDDLTGLPRRALLIDRLQEALKRCAREHSAGALLFVDLDHFKQVNDQHGHAGGDAVLRQVADRLRTSLRASDTAARVGGDEFVVLLPTVAHAGDALAVGAKLLAALAQDAKYGGRAVQVSASVGVAHFDGAGETAAQVMHRADLAMYAAKGAGRGQVWVL